MIFIELIFCAFVISTAWFHTKFCIININYGRKFFCKLLSCSIKKKQEMIRRFNAKECKIEASSVANNCRDVPTCLYMNGFKGKPNIQKLAPHLII